MQGIFYLPQCASTNDEVAQYFTLNEGCFAVYTFNQTFGRGQYGNVWKSEVGKNLALSFALSVGFSGISERFINYHTAVAVRDFLAKITAAEVKIKWPNDLIINGKKVCGILCERRKICGEDFYITGIGINVLQENFAGLARAGSLKTQCGRDFDLKDFAEHLYASLLDYFRNPMGEAEVLAKFNKNIFKKDEITVFEKNGERQNGIIQNADAEGFLWINLEKDGLQKFFHKEIEMLY